MATLTARPIPTYDPQSVLCRADLGGGCWEWNGHVTRFGYGTYGNKSHMAHRVVYEMLVKKLSNDEFLDHLCRNRKCVNPEHLEPISLVENVMRGESNHAKNARKTHCIRGHEFTTQNTYIHPKRRYRHCKACMQLHMRKAKTKYESKFSN